jgi:hypothetical protein
MLLSCDSVEKEHRKRAASVYHTPRFCIYEKNCEEQLLEERVKID